MSADAAKHPLIAGVEGGGTSFRCIVVRGDVVVDRRSIPTAGPEETLREVCEFLSGHEYDAIGISTFGPVDLKASSPSYGKIMNTPKEGWSRADVLSPILAVRNDVPYGFDTDVNAPALAEFERHNAPLPPSDRLTSLAYVTVGTGVGAGLVVNSSPVRGLMHPEAGHVPVIPLPADADAPPYPWGARTPFRGQNTVEGTASSVALAHRLKAEGGTGDRDALAGLPDEHAAWDTVANALACMCVTLILTVSVEKIVLGGGIMQRKVVLPSVRRRVEEMLNGYVPAALRETEGGGSALREDLIVESVWGDDAGIFGTVALGKRAWQERTKL